MFTPITMKTIIASILLTGCVLCTACRKELGYTGFEGSYNPIAKEAVKMSTDKACYNPGESVSFTADKIPAGEIYVRYRHLGDVVEEAKVTSAKWVWTAPSDNYKGYLVEIFQKTDDGDNVLGTIGVDVSSDWDRFPRYGFLSKFGTMDKEVSDAVIDNLNRFHINGVQFQDWHYKHHWPLGGTAENPLETYLDIASRQTSLTTLKNYISRIHEYGMKAIFYNLCFGVLDDAEEDGVSSSWYLYNESSCKTVNHHPLGAPFKSSIYLVDPGNPEWLEYIGEKNDDVYAVLDFDGYQIDQLGYRGTLYNAEGQSVSLPERYAEFINAMKSRHPEKDLIMNAVSNYGADKIIGTGKTVFGYNEMWAGESGFSSLRAAVEDNYRFSSDKCRTVFAAYMNYNVADKLGYFNTPGVILTDAVMFALGASHLELGEHMLGKEYFPNSNLVMKPDLKEAMICYYDFLVAYENLLRDGGSFNDISITSVNSAHSIKSWLPQPGKLTSLTKKVGNRQVVHLLNFIKADSNSWRDIDGTMPEPDLIESAVIDIPAEGEVKRVWMASPDHKGGAVEDLTYKSAGGKIRISIPHLKYWDMIVVEY